MSVPHGRNIASVCTDNYIFPALFSVPEGRKITQSTRFGSASQLYVQRPISLHDVIYIHTIASILLSDTYRSMGNLKKLKSGRDFLLLQQFAAAQKLL